MLRQPRRPAHVHARLLISASLLLALFLSACAPQPPQVLRLATTTSTADSGLLDAILPIFEEEYNAQVDVVAVGTGQALELGTNGDVDVVLVHARSREDAFVQAGDGLNRLDVMYNDFILVGPTTDPAGVSGLAAATEALTAIAAAEAIYVSRGDDSGTHTKEKSLWTAAEVDPAGAAWYNAIGQGMGESLIFANERLGYTLTDRATWLAQQATLPNLAIMVGGATIAENLDSALLNPYGVIPVNPEKHEGINFDLATDFANWLTSVETQELISTFGQEQYGQSLFYPSSAAWQAAHP